MFFTLIFEKYNYSDFGIAKFKPVDNILNAIFNNLDINEVIKIR